MAVINGRPYTFLVKVNITGLKQYGNFDAGIPSIDTMRRVFSALDSENFNDCFISWINHLCVKTKGEVIALDGKTVRGG